MSLKLTRAVPAAMLTAALVLALLFAGGAPTADAASAKSRAERAVVKALVLRHGVGTQARARCVSRSRQYVCGYAAVGRKRNAVYAGRALVNRKLRVRLGRAVCTGPGCKK